MRLLEWYRVDGSLRLRRVLVAAASSMALGSLLSTLSFLARRTAPVHEILVVVALASVAAGPVVAIVGLRRLLSEELYLGLAPDGLLLHFEEPAELVAWDAIERVTLDPATRAILLRLRSGETRTVARTFAGIDADVLARRLDHFRRRAGFGLLPRP